MTLGRFGHDHRDHRHRRNRIGHRPPARLRREILRLSSADKESARTLAAEIGRAAVVAADNRDAPQGADAAVLALRFSVLESVIDEIAES